LDALNNKGGESLKDPAQLADVMENSLNKEFPTGGKDYMNKARSVLFNLNDPKNKDFKSQLLLGFIAPEEVPKLSADQMASYSMQVERNKMRKESMEEIQTDWDLKHGYGNVSGMFTCGKCKSNRTVYNQAQTRCADEPMTTFVTCVACGNRWKC